MREEYRPVMSYRWAHDYPEYLGYYYQENPRGKCGVPGCPNSGREVLIERHIVRNPISGDVKEIGWICYGNWCEYHNLRIVDHRFVDYKAQVGVARRLGKTLRPRLREWGRKHPGEKLPASEVQRMAKDAEEERRIERAKRAGVYREDIPVHKFPHIGAVQAWAKSRGGFAYAAGQPVTIRNEKFWMVFLPKPKKER